MEGQRKVPGIAVAFVRIVLEQAILRIGSHRLDAKLFGDVSLEGANGNGRIDRGAAARVFTGRRADAPAHRGQRIG